MALKFTKLSVGDTVATSGTMAFKKLGVSAPSAAVAKGDNIIIDSQKSYRVMKIDGTTALLMANYYIFAPTEMTSTVTFAGGYVGAKYENSNLDTYLNSTYYESLSGALKAAIVPTSIKQSMYYVKWGTTYSDLKLTTSDGTVYSCGKIAETSIDGSRNVFILDIDDIVEYFGKGTTVSSSVLGELLYGSIPTAHFVLLRSATDITNALRIAGSDSAYEWNLIYSSSYILPSIVAPAFYVDLSKIDYEVDYAVGLTGTWQFNDELTTGITELPDNWTLNATTAADGYSVTIPYAVGGYTYYQITITGKILPTECYFNSATYGGSCVNGSRFRYYGVDYNSIAKGWYYEDGGQFISCSAPTIEIASKLTEVDEAYTLLRWLEANAVKQSCSGKKVEV